MAVPDTKQGVVGVDTLHDGADDTNPLPDAVMKFIPGTPAGVVGLLIAERVSPTMTLMELAVDDADGVSRLSVAFAVNE